MEKLGTKFDQLTTGELRMHFKQVIIKCIRKYKTLAMKENVSQSNSVIYVGLVGRIHLLLVFRLDMRKHKYESALSVLFVSARIHQTRLMSCSIRCLSSYQHSE